MVIYDYFNSGEQRVNMWPMMVTHGHLQIDLTCDFYIVTNGD